MIYLNNRKINEIKIGEGGSSYDWQALGFSEEPAALKANYDWAVNLQKNWSAEKYPDGYAINAEITKINSMGSAEMKPYLYFPYVDVSHITNMSYAFQNSIVQNFAEGLDTSNATSFNGIFGLSMIIDAPYLNYNNAMEMTNCFMGCFCLKTVNFDGLVLKPECTYNSVFYGCEKLEKIYMRGCEQATINRVVEDLKSTHPDTWQNIQIITE